MPESGSSPRKPRNHHSSSGSSTRMERTQRGRSRGDRLNLWQLLFGGSSRRKANQDQPATRLQVKQASFSVSEPPGEVLKSFRSNRKRVDAALEKANASTTQSFKRRTVLGRSRQNKISQLAGKDSIASQTSHSPDVRPTPKSRLLPRSAARTTLQSQNLTVIQQPRTTAQDQVEQLRRRREARGLSTRPARRSDPGTERLNALRSTRERKQMLPSTVDASAAKNRAAQTRRPDTARPRRPGTSAVLYAARMLILSIGVGVLAGTMLSVWDPSHRAPTGNSLQAKQAGVTASANPNQASGNAQIPKLGQEIAPLKSAIQSLATQTPQVSPVAFFLDLDTSTYVDLNGSAVLPAASTIKVPILVAFFQDVDAGKIRLDELLTMRKELIGGGSGEMQYQPPGTQFTALETVTKMIVISDNTATNMVIARLGGIAALNQRFKSWELGATTINNLLPDLEGTNTTSSKDMALLMARISQGDLVSMRSRDRMLEIMRKTVTDTLLPRGLGEGATIAHKTGDIGSLVGDVGLIDAPNGKRYAAAVLVKRPFNDDRAQELIRQISRVTYQHFSRSQAPASRSAAPQPSSVAQFSGDSEPQN